MLRCVPVSVLSIFVAAAPAVAQIAAPGPPGPYVVDLRGTTSALPVDAAFFPPAPKGTSLPSRGYGVEVGAHVYLFSLGPARLGVGASLLRVRGSASPAPPSSPSSGSRPMVAVTPNVATALTAIAPQLSLNFGSSAGWSYLSAGMGRARVTSVTSAFGGGGAEASATPAGEANSGTLPSLNYGGGARWFAKARLGVAFDVRVHKVSPGISGTTGQSTPRTTLMAASVGISVR